MSKMDEFTARGLAGNNTVVSKNSNKKTKEMVDSTIPQNKLDNLHKDLKETIEYLKENKEWVEQVLDGYAQFLVTNLSECLGEFERIKEGKNDILTRKLSQLENWCDDMQSSVKKNLIANSLISQTKEFGENLNSAREEQKAGEIREFAKAKSKKTLLGAIRGFIKKVKKTLGLGKKEDIEQNKEQESSKSLLESIKDIKETHQKEAYQFLRFMTLKYGADFIKAQNVIDNLATLNITPKNLKSGEYRNFLNSVKENYIPTINWIEKNKGNPEFKEIAAYFESEIKKNLTPTTIQILEIAKQELQKDLSLRANKLKPSTLPKSSFVQQEKNRRESGNQSGKQLH